MFDLRQKGKGCVAVTCSHPGCGWTWDVDALDPNLPDGPPGGWDCKQDHVFLATFDRCTARLRCQTGIRFCSLRLNDNEVTVSDRYCNRRGTLDAKYLFDVQVALEHINWKESILPAIGSKCPVVNYRWCGDTIRTWVKAPCTRPGCPHHVFVDYDNPDLRSGNGKYYEVGAWGRGLVDFPSWWGKRSFQCGDAVGSESGIYYPCNIVHGSEALQVFEESGIRWTVWDEIDLKGVVLFRDPESRMYGILEYARDKSCEVPLFFRSKRALEQSIRWYSENNVYSHFSAQALELCPSLSRAFKRHEREEDQALSKGMSMPVLDANILKALEQLKSRSVV